MLIVSFNTMIKPIFILSLPRSGSTLLQRLLIGSGKCSSLSEPSLLLRLLGDDYSMDRRAIYWEYLVTTAINDMRDKWPGFDEAYYKGVRELMHGIYSGLADNKEYFIDKTPRYTLIAHEIIKVFPTAKFIVLRRHPLAVAASMSEGRNYWYPEDHAIDLYDGLNKLNDFAEKYSDRICELRYEDLVVQPREELRRIGAYLGCHELESSLSSPLESSAGGSLGDRSGVEKYNAVSTESIKAWRKCYNNWYRRRWARHYFAGDRAAAMSKCQYEMPSEITQSSLCDIGLLRGTRDFFLAGLRARRRHVRPVWLRRASKQYQKAHGYGISYR